MDYKLSKFILKLYQHTSLIDENEFQEWAFEQTKQLIPFDSGQWGEWHVDKFKNIVVHRAYLHKQSQEKIEAYHQLQKTHNIEDPVALNIAQNLGKAFCFRDVAGTDEALWNTQLYKLFAKKYGMDHILATAVPHYEGEFFSAISLYREKKDRPFSEEEKILKEAVTPHLVESYRICLQSHVFSKLLTYDYKSIALVNAAGRLYIRMDNFTDSFNKVSETPISENTIQDRALLKMIHQEFNGYIKKTRLTSKMLPSGLFLVILHDNPLMEKLTPREIETTILAKQGKSYKEISEIMGIAEDTVRSFLRNAREKFGVSKTRQISI